MKSCRVIAFLVLNICATPSWAQNLISVKEGHFRALGKLDMRGVELEAWPAKLAGKDELVNRFLQPIALHGVNTLGISLQGQAGAGRFFSADGKTADPQAGQAFTAITQFARDHGFVLVVSLFSSEREYWLESAEAYRQAARTAAGLVGKKHSCVLVAGDLFGPNQWGSSPPYPMNDPAALLELAAIIKKELPNSVVAIPADSVAKQADAPDRRALFYAAQSSAELERIVTEAATTNATPSGGTAVCHKFQMFRRKDARGNFEAALRNFLEQMEKDRLATQMPPARIAGAPANELLSEDERSAGFTPLFDGRSLDGWTTLNGDWAGWSVEDGSIKCSGVSGPWLRSKQRFESFVLRLQYKISPKGNSGVFIRAPYDARASRFGMEVQIYGVLQDQLDAESAGAIYAVRPPLQAAQREPGQWNDLEIACHGPRIKVMLNGKMVQDFDSGEIPALRERLTFGCIGLQDHGNLVWFRKIRIRELSAN